MFVDIKPHRHHHHSAYCVHCFSHFLITFVHFFFFRRKSRWSCHQPEGDTSAGIVCFHHRLYWSHSRLVRIEACSAVEVGVNVANQYQIDRAFHSRFVSANLIISTYQKHESFEVRGYFFGGGDVEIYVTLV